MFPKPKAAICGGLQPYPELASELESLHFDLRNLMYHEDEQEVDFMPYLPLPALFDNGSPVSDQGRKILLIAGGNTFRRAPKHLIDMYSPYLKFDSVTMWDPDGKGVNDHNVPEEYLEGAEFVQTMLQVGSRDETDLITYLETHVRKEDYVVLMFDADAGGGGPTMEWGFLADLAAQKWQLVDELYIEMHYLSKKLEWGHDRHAGREATELLLQLRETCGFAVHAWP